ncbi:hypothetical protein E2C01_001401 [Portunus trituberculatus]|uniref:Uncharacterized protein n=1 Tax=Portunus trituberculatus TaxID=210409 RepID=A0A5B7CHW6_PORTR|nr:hypothetical protein [Portunus trituberculatus]
MVPMVALAVLEVFCGNCGGVVVLVRGCVGLVQAVVGCGGGMEDGNVHVVADGGKAMWLQ